MHTPFDSERPDRVLVIDAASGPREALSQALASDYRVTQVSDADSALRHLRSAPVDLVTLDLAVVGIGGDRWLRRLRAEFPALAIVVVTASASVAGAAEAVRSGACDYLEKPFDLAGLRRSVRRALDQLRERRYSDERLFGVVAAFLEAVEARHPSQAGHARRTALYADQLAEHMGLAHREREEVRSAAFLHSLGAAGASADARSPAPCDDARHAALGARIAENLSVSDAVVEAIRLHHARWDGHGEAGEPSGPGIPLAARIVAVADAYDALCTGRPGRAGLSPVQARRALTWQAGRRLDPVLTKEFVTLLESSDGDLQVIADTLDAAMACRSQTGSARRAEGVPPGAIAAFGGGVK